MRDKVSIDRVQLLHPAIIDDAISAIDEAEKGLPDWMAVRIVQGRRTKEEQDAIYAQGRTKPGKIVTKAKWYQTFHFYGLAVDFAILVDKNRDGKYEALSWDTVKDGDADGIADWQEIVAAFVGQGFEWGGSWRSFKDLPHVQKVFGHTWQQLYSKYLAKDFVEGTDFVRIG